MARTKYKKAALFSAINPFRKKVKSVDEKTGKTTYSTYNRISGKKVKDKTYDSSGNLETKQKYKGKDGKTSKTKSYKDGKLDSKIKYHKDTGETRKIKTKTKDSETGKTTRTKQKFDSEGNIKKYKKTSGLFKRAEKIKFKKDDKTGVNVVKKQKNVRADYDPATGQLTGDATRDAGYKYKVKKRPKKGGVQIKEKGVMVDSPFGGKSKGTRKRIVDDQGNVIKEKTRKSGVHTSSGWQDKSKSGEKDVLRGDYSDMNIDTSVTVPKDDTPKDTPKDTTKDTTPKDTTPKKESLDDLSFGEAYKKSRAAAKESGVKDFYGDKKGHFTWKGKSYNVETKEEKKSRMKNVKSSLGGQRRLGGAITGGIGGGGSQGPHGIL